MEALFTDHERKKPWVLWLTPGFLPAILLHILLRILVFRHLRQIIEPDQRNWPVHFDGIFYLRMCATMLLVAVFSVILAPLDVIVTRLAIQRNYGNPKIDPASEVLEVEAMDLEKAQVDFHLETQELTVWYVKTTHITTNHPISLRLRQDKDLYHGLYDCAMRIVREEGWQVLYRGWWLALLGTMSYY